MKRCPRCKTEKPDERFWRTPGQPSKLSSYCKECLLEWKRERRRNNPDAVESERRSNRVRMARRRAEMSQLGIVRKWHDSGYAVSKVKQSCYNRYRRALNSGKLVRPANCSICGSTRQIQGHHLDYQRPLDVLWLCVDCHKAVHRKTDRLEPACEA